MYFVYVRYFLALNRRHKPFLALLGDRPSYSYFLNRRSGKQGSSYLTGKSSKPIVPIVFFHMKRNDYPHNYIWRKALNYIWRKTVIRMRVDHR